MGKLKKKTQKWRSTTAENIQGKKSHDNCKARLKELSKAKFWKGVLKIEDGENLTHIPFKRGERAT